MKKDFLWWLLKENIVINFIYREIFRFIFPIKLSNEQLDKYPLSDKNTIVNYTQKHSPLFSIKGFTSGTTNNPLTVYRSIKSIFLEEYIVKSYFKVIGAPLRPNMAILRGDHIEVSKDTFWKKMPFTKRLFLSSYHISQNTAASYFNQLEHYQPDIIMAYPSSITLLAKHAIKLNWKPNWNLSGIVTSSESFSMENQKIVRSVFGNVFDHYGQAERVAVLQQCTHGHYHVREDYSQVEFIPDEHGMRIIGTNYYNKAMPLKRYDTKDYVEGLNQSGDCKCGNTSPYVTRILGRDDDYVVLPDGRQIGRLDVVFKQVKGLIECQLEQTSLTELVVNYVSEDNADVEKVEHLIKNGLEQRLGNDIAILFKKIEYVPRTKTGKFRAVIRSREIISI